MHTIIAVVLVYSGTSFVNWACVLTPVLPYTDCDDMQAPVCTGKTPAKLIIESVTPVSASPDIVIRNTGGQTANITGYRLSGGAGRLAGNNRQRLSTKYAFTQTMPALPTCLRSAMAAADCAGAAAKLVPTNMPWLLYQPFLIVYISVVLLCNQTSDPNERARS